MGRSDKALLGLAVWGLALGVSPVHADPLAGTSEPPGKTGAAQEAPDSQAVRPDLLRSVPLEIQGYLQAKTMPEKFTTASQVLGYLTGRDLAVHMEVLRRGYHDLPATERDKVMQELTRRHKMAENDVIAYFHLGYAELLYRRNKTGLFFLRKANDRLATQFSSLAYAMAQADADLELEGASPTELNTRKMDVMYKLTDAVMLDAKQHQPGFWPSFVRVVEKLKPLAAYVDTQSRDYSLAYVPYGNNPGASDAKTVKISMAEEKPSEPLTDSISHTASCTGGGSAPIMDWAKLARSKTIDLLGNGQSQTINFFRTDAPDRFQVIVLDDRQQVWANFESPVFYITEDLDGDGVTELVVRRFKTDPLQPVKVYRYEQCAYKLDKTVEAYFQ